MRGKPLRHLLEVSIEELPHFVLPYCQRSLNFIPDFITVVKPLEEEARKAVHDSGHRLSQHHYDNKKSGRIPVKKDFTALQQKSVFLI